MSQVKVNEPNVPSYETIDDDLKKNRTLVAKSFRFSISYCVLVCYDSVRLTACRFLIRLCQLTPFNRRIP